MKQEYRDYVCTASGGCAMFLADDRQRTGVAMTKDKNNIRQMTRNGRETRQCSTAACEMFRRLGFRGKDS